MACLWSSYSKYKLTQHSKVAQTPLGPVEYIKTGSPPYLLAIHGYGAAAKFCNGAYSQAWRDAGIGVLSVSRPGYGLTPLSNGPEFEKAADLVAALLDVLDVGPVVAHGFSGGGPCAILLAVRHPKKVLGLSLSYCILKKVIPPEGHFAHDVNSDTFKNAIAVMGSGCLGGVVYDFRCCAKIFAPEVGASAIVNTSNFTDEEKVVEAKRIAKESGPGLQVAFDYMEAVSSWSALKEGMANDLIQISKLSDVVMLGQADKLKKAQIPIIIQHGLRDDPVDGADPKNSKKAAQLLGCEFYTYANGPHILQVCDEAALYGAREVAFFKKVSRPV